MVEMWRIKNFSKSFNTISVVMENTNKEKRIFLSHCSSADYYGKKLNLSTFAFLGQVQAKKNFFGIFWNMLARESVLFGISLKKNRVLPAT